MREDIESSISQLKKRLVESGIPDSYSYESISEALPKLSEERLAPVAGKALNSAVAREIREAHDRVLARLREKGMIKGARDDGGWNVQCPFEDAHTSGENLSECVYWPAHTGGFAERSFKCLHAHCNDRSRADFLAALSLNADDRLGRLTVVDVGDLFASDSVDPEFCIAPWIPLRQTTLLAGHGGLGKSYFALVLAAHIAVGRDFANLEVEQGRVLFVTLEDEPRLLRWRLLQIIDAYDIDRGELARNLTILDGTESFTPLLQVGESMNANAASTSAFDEVKRQAVGCRLVVIDNASDAFDANENVRRHVRLFVSNLTGIARDNNSAVLLLAHIDKSSAKYGASGESYSGSTAWHNSARSRLALDLDGEQLLIRHEKNNLGRCAEDLQLFRNRYGVPTLTESLGANAKRFIQRQRVLDLFLQAETANHSIPARIVPGNGSAMGALAQLAGCPKEFRSRSGKRDLATILIDLKSEGYIEDLNYRDGHRHEKTRLTLTVQGRSFISAGPSSLLHTPKSNR